MRVATKLSSDDDWIKASDEYESYELAALGEGTLAGVSGGDLIAVKNLDTGEVQEFVMEMELAPRRIASSSGERV